MYLYIYLSIKIRMSDRPTALHTATRPQQRYRGIPGRGVLAHATEVHSAESKQGQDDTERSDVSACLILLPAKFLNVSVVEPGSAAVMYDVVCQIHMADLVHRMGGSIRKDFSAKITHMVANSTSGEKYRVCSFLRHLIYHRI